MELAWLLVAAAVMLLGGRPTAAPVRVAEPVSPALALDLLAVALRAGQPPARALSLAAGVATGPAADGLTTVARLLHLGADPPDAWAALADHPDLAPIAAAGARSSSSGLRAAAEFERLAGDLRSEQTALAQARAARAGVYVAAPLGLCFLPAFVCLGIVPTVVGVVRSVFSA